MITFFEKIDAIGVMGGFVGGNFGVGVRVSYEIGSYNMGSTIKEIMKNRYQWSLLKHQYQENMKFQLT